jgi:hypothetical protein
MVAGSKSTEVIYQEEVFLPVEPHRAIFSNKSFRPSGHKLAKCSRRCRTRQTGTCLLRHGSLPCSSMRCRLAW